MAWVLQFDGGNDYALADFNESMAQSFTIKVRFRSSDLTQDARLFALTRGASRPLIAIGTGVSVSNRDNIRFFVSSDSNVTEIDYTTTDIQAAPFGDGLFHELSVFFDNGSLSMILDGGTSVSIGSYTPANYTVEQISLGAIFRTAPAAFLECDVEYVTVTGGASYDWDATASSHAAGTPRLKNTLDGTGLTDMFTSGMPTDGSAWLDLGGGGISIAVLLNSNYMVEYNMKKNVAGQSVGAQMITISDGSDFTGSVSVEVTKDNGTKAAGAGAVVHEGGGYHSYAPTQAETNGDHLAFSFSGTGALSKTIQTYTSFPQSVDNDIKVSLIPTTPMRGTDSANTVVPPSVAEFNARTIPSADYFVVTDYTAPDNASITATLADTNELQLNQGSWLTADVSGLSTFDYTVNAVVASNMRGTDGANTITPDNTGIAANGLKIDNLENVSVAQIFSGGDVDTYSLEESLKLMLAANVGILSGAATNSIIIKAADGSKTRLTASVDVDGNRTAVTKDATG